MSIIFFTVYHIRNTTTTVPYFSQTSSLIKQERLTNKSLLISFSLPPTGSQRQKWPSHSFQICVFYYVVQGEVQLKSLCDLQFHFEIHNETGAEAQRQQKRKALCFCARVCSCSCPAEGLMELVSVSSLDRAHLAFLPSQN